MDSDRMCQNDLTEKVYTRNVKHAAVILFKA